MSSSGPTTPPRPDRATKALRNRRRRGRELALQGLFALDHQRARGATSEAEALADTLRRLRERALAAELECRAADGAADHARELATALGGLAPRHPLVVEVEAWLAGKGPIPLAPTDDERAELDAVRGDLETLEFCEAIVRGVSAHLDEIDRLLGSSSTNWRVSRMAVVDRNILRMGVFEMQHLGDIPPRVTLNEAIEIGKRYGTSESGAFINGILDKIATQLGHVGARGGGGNGGGGGGARGAE